LLGCSNFTSYYRRLVADDGEEELLQALDLVTTNETRFFRESRQFEFLVEHMVPSWLAAAEIGTRQRHVSVWSASCASGEEPYSVAMALRAALPRSWSLRILATDLSARMLLIARRGVWPMARLDEIPEEYRRSFLMRGTGDREGEFCMGPEVRALVRFERLNLVEPPHPCGKFDLVLCRNTLMFFDGPTRRKVISELRSHLVSGGWLWVGHAEALVAHETGLRSVRASIYQCPDGGPRGATVSFEK
jgi:chemotaxis protein methyltransferase CheR